MRCIIEDNTTPKTGGVTTSAHQTTASRFELHISYFVLVSDFDIRISDFPPFPQNEPNSAPADLWKPKKNKTNPIYRPTTPLSTICYLLFLTKQTQFTAETPESTNYELRTTNYALFGRTKIKKTHYYILCIAQPA
ncbi:MAG: hypothetical protein DRP66_08405 [Planctomycetota bacterium]|nr:MAG: hypothetical protein DRP66_08405 [Planctomycetota bacterium]